MVSNTILKASRSVFYTTEGRDVSLKAKTAILQPRSARSVPDAARTSPGRTLVDRLGRRRSHPCRCTRSGRSLSGRRRALVPAGALHLQLPRDLRRAPVDRNSPAGTRNTSRSYLALSTNALWDRTQMCGGKKNSFRSKRNMVQFPRTQDSVDTPGPWCRAARSGAPGCAPPSGSRPRSSS